MKTKTKPVTPQTAPAPAAVAAGALLEIEQEAIVPAGHNRSDLELDEEFVRSIAEQGVLEPIIVRPLPRYELRSPDLLNPKWRVVRDDTGILFESEDEQAARMFLFGRTGNRNGNGARYEIVAGERRWSANAMAKRPIIPAVVRALNDREAREVRLIENLQRRDLKPLDEAAAFQEMIDSGDYTPESLAQRLNKSRSHIFARLRLLKLIEPVRHAVAAGKLPQTIAELIATLPTDKLQKKALDEIIAGGPGFYDDDKPGEASYESYHKDCMSFRQAKAYLAQKFQCDLDEASWDLKDEKLVAEAGACVTCPKRSGTDPAAFPHLKHPNVCTDPECYARKRAAAAEKALAAHVAKGHAVMTGKECAKVFGGYSLGGGYVEGSHHTYDTKKSGTYRELLGKDLPQPVYGVDDKGKVCAVYRKAEVEAALAAKGLLRKESKPDPAKEAAAERRAERARRLEAKTLARIVTAALDVIEAKPFDQPMLHFLVDCLRDGDWGDDNVILPRRGWKQEDVADKRLGQQKADVLRGFLVECCLCGSSWQPGYQREQVERVAALARVNIKAIEKQVAAEFDREEAAKETTKAAAKPEVKTKKKK